MIPITHNKMPLSSAFIAQAQQECLSIDRPSTLEQAHEATARFQIHYNHERPNQALACGNRPPRQAFPTLPKLPSVPTQVDPDAWLKQWHGKHFQRHPSMPKEQSVSISNATG